MCSGFDCHCACENVSDLMKNAILIIGAIDAFPNRILIELQLSSVCVDRALRHIPTDASI